MLSKANAKRLARLSARPFASLRGTRGEPTKKLAKVLYPPQVFYFARRFSRTQSRLPKPRSKYISKTWSSVVRTTKQLRCRRCNQPRACFANAGTLQSCHTWITCATWYCSPRHVNIFGFDVRGSLSTWIGSSINSSIFARKNPACFKKAGFSLTLSLFVFPRPTTAVAKFCRLPSWATNRETRWSWVACSR